MRIEKCVEDDGDRRITVYVDDDTVRATDHEAVRDLIRVLLAALAAGESQYGDIEGESNEQA